MYPVKDKVKRQAAGSRNSRTRSVAGGGVISWAPAPVAPPQGPIVPPPAPVAPPPAPIAPPPAPIGPPQAPFVPPQAPLAPPPSPLAPLTILIPEPVLPPFAGAGGGGGTCFSTDTWVTTPNGKKRMDQLKVGDFVLTANETVAYFTPMMLWIHREPNVVTKFVTIMTDYGKMLALTARHLIFRNKCDEYYVDRVEMLPPNSQAVYAEELKVGDCVFLLYKVIHFLNFQYLTIKRRPQILAVVKQLFVGFISIATRNMI
ncbi:hypothetical protein GCK32_008533 [Trichostrongylus colubriformis]|uniref:Hint domain-containing protein n=1 Tax=Trichostrongylus colubriformis TaxID=6319 RepID=A0AAN8G2L0_TRICO